MDLRTQYEREIKYYQYIEEQRNNSVILGDENSSVKQFADILFSKKIDDVSNDLSSLLFCDDTELLDVFCILLELVLFGFDRFGKNLFEIDNQCDDFIYDIKKYLKSMGFDMSVDEIFHFLDNVNLFADKKDYYCQITPKPHPFFCTNDWFVSNHRLIINRNFEPTNIQSLDQYFAYFVNKNKQIFSIRFTFLNCGAMSS